MLSNIYSIIIDEYNKVPDLAPGKMLILVKIFLAEICENDKINVDATRF